LTQSCMFAIWRVCTGPLNSSFGSMLAKPFWSDANGTSCHALKLSSCVHDCQPVVNGHETPAAFSFAMSATTACHVSGGLLGSMPAFSKASLLYQNTVVELLNGNDSIWPLVFV